MNSGKGNFRVGNEAFAAVMAGALHDAVQRFALAVSQIAQAVEQMGTGFASATAALQTWSPNGLAIPPIEDAE